MFCPVHAYAVGINQPYIIGVVHRANLEVGQIGCSLFCYGESDSAKVTLRVGRLGLKYNGWFLPRLIQNWKQIALGRIR